jgi:hypothetical protein
MSFRKWFGVTVACTLLGVLAGTSNGCSSSSGGGGAPSDAASDGPPLRHPEGGGVDTGAGGDDSGSDAGMPGTSGKACKSAADCNGNVCSNQYAFTITNIKVELWPQPICIVPIPPPGGAAGNCDPAPPTDPTGLSLHFCDGPDDPTAPGICLANNFQMPQSMQGFCLPKCTFKMDGSAATGCPAPDTCVPFTFVLDQTGAVTGYGFCQGSCTQDADCSALGPTYKCQTDIGFCTTAPVARGEAPADAGAEAGAVAGAIGSACTKAQNDMGFCNCESGQAAPMNGYCTRACVVGDANNPCPDGYVCDVGLGTDINFGDAGMFTLAADPKGSAGTCQAKCTVPDSGVGTDGGPQCPPASGCIGQTVVGPDCYPNQ